MGLCASEQSNRVGNINTKLIKVNTEISFKVDSILKQVANEEKRLLSEFKKQEKKRNKFQEETFAQEIVLKLNHITSRNVFKVVYKIVQSHVQKLLDFNKSFETDKVPQSLHISFKTIVYCDSILRDQNLSNFCLLLRQNYRKLCIAKDEEIKEELVVFHKNNHMASKTMVNEYLLKLINTNGLKFQEVKKVGHQIGYGM